MGSGIDKVMAQAEVRHLLHPLGHWHAISQQRGQIVRERIRLACFVLCGFMLAMAGADLVFLSGASAWQVAGARVLAGFVFLGISVGLRIQGSPHATWMALALMHFILPALHLSVQPILAASGDPAASVLLRLSSQLPVVTVAWMSLFPLTVVETIALSLPLLAFVLIGLSAISGATTSDVVASVGPLALLVAVSAVSGASQLSHLISLVIRSTHDGLTGCLNRKAGEEILDLQMRMAERNHAPLTVLFLDIDNFKSVNDTYGHEAGDEVLRAVADSLREKLRLTDKAIRWGGEEFVVVLPATSGEGLRIVVERLRAGLGLRPDGKPVTVSMGGGMTGEAEAGTTPDHLVALADARMYKAKKGGKDRFIGPADLLIP